MTAMVALAVFMRASGYDRPPMSGTPSEGFSSCAECHLRAGDDLTLRKDRDCVACHQEIGDRLASSPHGHPGPSGSGRAVCLDCHAFHDASPRFLPGDPIESCAKASCHPEQLDEGSHPVGGIDPRTGRTMTCTSDCHDPHGSRFKWFCKSAPGRDLCVGCHEDLK